jgi:hypothetical protein
MTKYDLRRLAERVAGFPELDIDLVPSTDASGALEAVERAPGSPAHADAVVTIAGDVAAPNRKPITLSADRPITIQKFHGGSRTYTLADCDCVCTSVAAFEKFFLPYYLPLMTAEQFARFRTVMDDPAVLCVVHLPTSEPSIGDLAGSDAAYRVDFAPDSSTYVVASRDILSRVGPRFTVADGEFVVDDDALVALPTEALVGSRE